ncbi:uncharacterized protein LOC110924457 [Helianthus annuus]|uniref:uncharacterized protein LOC110924457 n=1 Tax=Helianthus annuus TaxID=4232 RepID=UPI000B9045C4|nr:uncharacterized protein LOC110924457 [Helianthus annuus]
MKKKEVGAVQYSVCEECGDIGYRTENCQATADVNQVYGGRRQYDMNSNTYHPGLRNHPNFRYGNASNQMNPNFPSGNQGGSSHQNRQSGNQGYQGPDNNYQSGYQRNYNNQGCNGSGSNNQGGGSDLNAKMDTMLSMMQESNKENEIRDKSHEALAKQVGQLAEEVAQRRGSMGKLPSDTTMNPKHQSSSTDNVRNVHISAVSLLPNDENCSVQSIPPPQFVDGVVEDISNEPESENEQEMISHTKTKNVPTLVECLKELSNKKRHNKLPKLVDLISHVSVVLSSALPQKAQDPGDPLILIQIGTFKIERALQDLGACVSILPGSFYDQYDFGPLKKFDTPVVLAD